MMSIVIVDDGGIVIIAINRVATGMCAHTIACTERAPGTRSAHRIEENRKEEKSNENYCVKISHIYLTYIQFKGCGARLR